MKFFAMFAFATAMAFSAIAYDNDIECEWGSPDFWECMSDRASW